MVTRPRLAGQRLDGARSGKVRVARLTDLAAVGELSRLSHASEDQPAPIRSLGLPLSAGQISVFTLFRLPLGAFRPHDLLYVYELDGRLAGLLRCEREAPRDEWTIVELDAVDHGEAGDIRFRLVQQLLRDGSRRGAARFHVACADEGGNVELFMQAGFVRYGEERILYRSPDAPLPPPVAQVDAEALGIRPSVATDALDLDRLYRAATPVPVARLEGYRLPDWERQGSQWRIPRSSLTPILRFADVEAFVQECPGPRGPELVAFAQVGVAKEDHPHYVKVIARPGHDVRPLVDYVLGIITERSGAERSQPERAERADRGARAGHSATRLPRGGHRNVHGVVSAVRTYEAPIDRRLEDVGFASTAVVTLLMKETLVRVAEPALVPAIR